VRLESVGAVSIPKKTCGKVCNNVGRKSLSRMTVLAIAAAFFVTSFLLQYAIWRIRLPQRQIRALLILYLVTPVVIVIVARALGYSVGLSSSEMVRVWVLYLPVSLAYFALYAAIELSSPTLLIISYLSATKGAGCGAAELLEHFNKKVELRYRFELMEQSGLIKMTGDLVEILPSGRVYGNIFESMSRVFGLQKGG